MRYWFGGGSQSDVGFFFSFFLSFFLSRIYGLCRYTFGFKVHLTLVAGRTSAYFGHVCVGAAAVGPDRRAGRNPSLDVDDLVDWLVNVEGE